MAYLVVQLLIAIACAGVASTLLPRKIPGGFGGLILLGLAGVWFGGWAYSKIYTQFGLAHSLLNWQIQGVLILPSIAGSMVLLYIVSAIAQWWRVR